METDNSLRPRNYEVKLNPYKKRKEQIPRDSSL